MTSAPEQEKAFERLCEAADRLGRDIADYANKVGMETPPSAGSEAEVESRILNRREESPTLIFQSWVLVEATCDHLWAAVRLLDEPAIVTGFYGAARNALDTASLALWLLEEGIGYEERLARSLAHRFDDLQSQIVIARESKDADLLIFAASRSRELVRQGEAWGLKIGKGKKGLPTTIGAGVPPSVQLIERYLKKGVTYRLLSAVVHGQSSALLQSGYRLAKPMIVEKHLDADSAASVLTAAVTSFARAAWAYFRYMGQLSPELVAALEQAFDELSLNDEERFWR